MSSAPARSEASETESKSPTITSAASPTSRSASAPPSTATSTGRKSRTYGRTIRRSDLYPGPRATTSTCRSRKRVRSVGSSRPAASEPASSCRWRSVFSANAWSAWETRLCWSARASPSDAASSTVPSATSVPFRQTLPPSSRTRSPSASSSNSGAPGASTSRTPARTSSSGPGFGKRPVEDREMLTTARTPLSASSSADTRSMSAWSTIATSWGPRRLTRSFVRRPSRARPVISPFISPRPT